MENTDIFIKGWDVIYLQCLNSNDVLVQLQLKLGYVWVIRAHVKSRM